LICNVCETKLNENELVCSKCGELVAVNEKKKELELQKEKTKKIISENISSTKGLVYGVFLTVILVISLIAAVDSLLDKSYVGAIICILSFAMALNSVLAVWNLYKKKDGDVQKWLKNLGNYSKFLNAMWVFVTIIVIFICTILLLIGLAANELASDLGGFLNEVELGFNADDCYMLSFGSKGIMLKDSLSIKYIISEIKQKLKLEKVRFFGDINNKVRCIHFGLGQCLTDYNSLSKTECELYICGEVYDLPSGSYCADAKALGLNKNIIALGHYSSEFLGMKYFAEFLANKFNNLQVDYVDCGEFFEFI